MFCNLEVREEGHVYKFINKFYVFRTRGGMRLIAGPTSRTALKRSSLSARLSGVWTEGIKSLDRRLLVIIGMLSFAAQRASYEE